MPKPVQSVERYLSGLQQLAKRDVRFMLVSVGDSKPVMPVSIEYPKALPAVTLWFHFFDGPLPSSDNHAFRLWGAPKSVYLGIRAALIKAPDHDKRLRKAILETLRL